MVTSEAELGVATVAASILRLLVVDDDPDFCELIRSTAPEWLEVTGCESSQDAIRVIDGEGGPLPDLALIDIEMPPHLEHVATLEGLALAHWLQTRSARIPVILVSGRARTVPENPLARATYLPLLRKPLMLAHLFAFLGAYRDLFPRAGPT
jgi:CheY-like chemotaxis protein